MRIFINRSIAALCLGLTAFTVVTGDLAFGLTPLLDKVAVEEAEQAEDAAATAVIRLEEPAARALIDKLESGRQRLKEEDKQIEMRRQSLEALEANARRLRKTLDDTETRISTILDNIDETEKANLKGLAHLISQIEDEAGH
jgi:septal ring factor EnvC (AmiA/AmiB activator)